MIESGIIIKGDCVGGMRNLSSESADIVIADPPYNIGKDFGNDSDKRSLSEYKSWCQLWIRECVRILKITGTMFIYGFPETLAHISAMFPLEKQRWLVWHYTNKTVPHLDFWQRSHESIICVWKDSPIFNRDMIREPYTEAYVTQNAGKTRAAGSGRFAKGKGVQTTYNAHENGAMPRDVLKIPALAGGAALCERNIYCEDCACLVNPAKRKEHDGHKLIIHPTQKPLALTEKLILSCKPQGKFNVLVPFCGSGSECAAVLKNGGNFIGFELNSDYIKLARAIIGKAFGNE